MELLRKSLIEKMIDFVKANQKNCLNNIKKSKDKDIKKQLNTALNVYNLVLMQAEKLLKEESDFILKDKCNHNFIEKFGVDECQICGENF